VWDCYDQAGDTVCQTAGGDLPDGEGSGEWHCEVQGEFVVCTREAPDYPDEAGDTPWDCHYEDEFRICAPPDSPSSPWPDGWSDVCTASSARWCDDAVYCSWGRQTCRPDGHWGPCIEPSVTATGTITDRPATACACRYFLFNEDCCEDQSDRDGDLHADCIVPADHVAPSCTSDGSLCSFCDVHSQCGGDADFCLFGDDGYAFCGQDCSSAPCPAGYTCSPVPIPGGTAQQCTPMGGLCD